MTKLKGIMRDIVQGYVFDMIWISTDKLTERKQPRMR